MSLFKKLFGKPNPAPENQSFEVPEGFNMEEKPAWSEFDELFHQHVGLSFEKQLNLSDLIQSHGWQLDMGSGTILFGSDISIPIQVIGTFSFNDSSWMWGWANEKSGIPPNLLQDALKMKEIGEQKGLSEFTEGHYAAAEGFEHKIGMVASGLMRAKAYYCANYGQGTLVATLSGDAIKAIDQNQPEKVVTTFPQLISAMEISHRPAFHNYLIDRGYQVKHTESTLEGYRQGKTITGTFDEAGRLTDLSGKL